MRYEFIVRGNVPEAVMAALPGFTLSRISTGGSALCGQVPEEATLLSIVTQLGDFGLSVVEIRALPD